MKPKVVVKSGFNNTNTPGTHHAGSQLILHVGGHFYLEQV